MVHIAPRMRDPGGEPMGIGKISARDAYRYERSLERYHSRPDALSREDAKAMICQGEIGHFYGMTITSDCYQGEQNAV